MKNWELLNPGLGKEKALDSNPENCLEAILFSRALTNTRLRGCFENVLFRSLNGFCTQETAKDILKIYLEGIVLGKEERDFAEWITVSFL